MDLLFIVFSSFSMLSCVSTVDYNVCPIQCACSFHQVDCYGRNLQEIPPNISNTTYYIDLQENDIQRIQPERLSRLIKLDDLLLRRNKLTKLESRTFVNLTSLKRLVLSGNDIETIQPDTFVNLPSLQVLDLSSNLISNITGLFVHIPSVERLVLSLNQITELNDDSFDGLDKLQYLILSQNQITSISSGAFSKLNILSYLVLRGNPISQADGLWGGLKVLSFLDLSSCELTEVPSGLPYTLSILRLGNNSIQTIKSTDFRALKYLGVLYLEKNMISSVQHGAFSYSPHLSQIEISGNRLTQLPGTLPAQIELFIADNNYIKHIFKTNFANDSVMKTLSMRNNSISDLAGNTFGRLSHLNTLHLDNNEIRIMYNMTFQGLNNLQKLSLSSNPVREIQFRALGGLPKLYYLVMSNLSSPNIDMKGNFLRDVPFLTTLDLHQSPSLVGSILGKPDMLWTLSTVKYLNLMGNNLTHLSTDLMMAMPKLRWIKATKNPWHCDAGLIPLRAWMGRSYRTFSSSSQMKCASPPSMEGKSILGIPVAGFTMPTSPTTTSTTKTTTMKPVSVTKPTPTISTKSTFLPTKSKVPIDSTTKKTTQNSSKHAEMTTKIVKTTTMGRTTRSSVTARNTATVKSPQTSKATSGITTTNEKSSGFSSVSTTKRATSLPTSTKKPNTPTKPAQFSSSIKTFTRPSSSPPSKTSNPTTTQRVVTPRASIITKSDSSRPQPSTAPFQTTSAPAPTSSKSVTTSQSSSKFITDNLASSTLASSSTRSRQDKLTTLSSSRPVVTASSASATTDTSKTVTIPVTSVFHSTATSDRTSAADSTNRRRFDGDSQQGEHRHLPSRSSSDKPNDKGLIIGLVTGSLCLVVILVVIILMVRYQKRKKEKAFFIDHDISFATNKEETSDTVCIINHLHEQPANQDSRKVASQNDVDRSGVFKHSEANGTKGQSTHETSRGKTSNRSSVHDSGPSNDDHHDDTDLLMDSW